MSSTDAMDSTARSPLKRLSVCMIVKNEAEILERCLKSLGTLADEIIVVDTGSTDGTIEIAQRFGRVIESDWRDDFSYSRNLSIRAARYPWILWLDADDILPESSIAPLRELATREPDRVYALTVRNQKPGNTGSEFVQARLFPNRPDLFFERRIHEQIMLSALRAGLSMESVPIVVEHHGYANPAVMVKKAQRNIRLLMQEYDNASPDPILAVEIADSYTIAEDDKSAEHWYTMVLGMAGVKQTFPAIASQAYLGLGNIENQKERFELAADHFGQALKLAPDRPDALYSLGVALDLSKRPAQALEALKRILDVEDKPLQVSVDFRMARIKAFLRIERINRELKNDPETLVLAEKVATMVPSRPEILNATGTVQYRMGKTIDALHSFEKSLGVVIEGNIDAFIGLCMVYEKAGRTDLVKETEKTMEGLFGAHPRFSAYRSLFDLGNSVNGTADPAVQEKISDEKRSLREAYGIKS